MILQRSTWPAVERYLGRCTGILIPVGSTEQHGPGGMLGTDAICPETIGYRFAEDPDVLVGPTLSIGMAQHHLAFPGSIALRPTTMIAMVMDVVNSLARNGFSHFYFLNGHGGNVATVEAAFSELHSQRSFGQRTPPLHCRLANWYALPSVQELSAELFGDKEGSHGTPSELSLSYHAYPEDAAPVAADPPQAPAGTFTDAENLRLRYPDGRIGCDPSDASAEHGARFCDLAYADVQRDWAGFVVER